MRSYNASSEALSSSLSALASILQVRDMIDEHLHNLFFNNVVIQGRMGEVEAAVLDGEMSESQAVEELIGDFDKSIK